MSISRALGAEKPATKRPRRYMKGPRGRKASCKTPQQMHMEGPLQELYPPCASAKKRGAARALPPRLLVGGALCAHGILARKLSISTYLSVYMINYIYISTY